MELMGTIFQQDSDCELLGFDSGVAEFCLYCKEKMCLLIMIDKGMSENQCN